MMSQNIQENISVKVVYFNSDKECKNGGWPMVSPNPNAKDIKTAQKLVDITYNMVGLSK